ncbi:MAG: zinc-ribbon domain-containing protein [Firmicutes bacterium]|nr:zinc-ribbon domain-containing protein [Bacillota bacterium]
MFCQNCGKESVVGSKFCASCGSNLETGASNNASGGVVFGPNNQPMSQGSAFFSNDANNNYHRAPQQSGGDGLAIGALVCGILGISLIALILGIVALKKG